MPSGAVDANTTPPAASSTAARPAATSAYRPPAAGCCTKFGWMASTAPITMTVLGALEGIPPTFVQQPAAGGRYALVAAGLAAVLLAAGGVVFASTAPDGIARLARQTGISGHARTLISTPLKNYEASWLGAGWLAQAG